MGYKNPEDAKTYHQMYRLDNYSDLADKRVAYVKRIRLEGLAAYGDKCACCSESLPEFLTLDHINGREPEDTSAVTGYKRTGHKMWLKVRRLGYPKDSYQLLCFNCNCAKSIYGKCPHAK